MRLVMIAATATLLVLSAAVQASAFGISAVPSVEGLNVVVPAAAKKKPPVKKKEKVEYMRAAPM